MVVCSTDMKMLHSKPLTGYEAIKTKQNPVSQNKQNSDRKRVD